MTTDSVLTLVNPTNGNLAFKISHFHKNHESIMDQGNNYFSLIWIRKGTGKIRVDFSDYDFEADTLFAFSPYQPFLFKSTEQLSGIAIHFHPDFYCIHLHEKEISCNGVLFNNLYQAPFTRIDTSIAGTFNELICKMETEMQNPDLAQYELLISYLKIFLITGSRLKTQQEPKETPSLKNLKQPFILQTLREAIEKDFKKKHSASDYAESLNISTKALAKITKSHFNKTLTNLISERIIVEAKRELYMTNKSVKEIAYDLGYQDEHYFSRFFKTNANISPQMYRDTVGVGRGV